ncbi:hypothetical protein HMPREF0379_1487 [[Eubacterium] yurii subsp. margaretiae ATCC 43715]|nr:hypothetical protein HMPREF0379_1487 [[Eubacterium] yurii subsp. margaretiae ATCC 43715]
MKRKCLRNISSILVASALLISGNSLVYALDEFPHHNQAVIVNDSKHDMIESFIEESISQKPNIEIEKINEYSDNFLSIYKLYKEFYPNETKQAIIEKATTNVLNKIENTVDETEYREGKYRYSSLKDEPDGYEWIVNYINDNLNPNYDATLDTTEMNIEILKKNMNKMPEKTKNLATLYIEDMEGDSNSIKNHSNASPKINMLSIESEKENASAAVSYAKRYWKNYNSDYPNWGLYCANFVFQCLYAGNKEMKNRDENSITVKLLDVSLTKVSYEKVILLNSFDENDNKELEKLQVPISEMPSGVYLKEFGIQDSSEVIENTKVSIFDIRQKYTDSSDRRYVFKTWEDFVSANKDDEELLKGRFYIISFKDNKINSMQEKLYL